jgi:hypothetical protein
MFQLRGSATSPDAGLLAYRELDAAICLSAIVVRVERMARSVCKSFYVSTL